MKVLWICFWGLLSISLSWASVIANDTLFSCLEAFKVMALMNGELISPEKGYFANGTLTLLDLDLLMKRQFTDSLSVKIIEFYSQALQDVFTLSKITPDEQIEPSKGKGSIRLYYVLSNTNSLDSFYVLGPEGSPARWGIEKITYPVVREKLGIKDDLHTLPSELAILKDDLNAKIMLLLVISANMNATSGMISAYNFDRFLLGMLFSSGLSVDDLVELFWKIRLPSLSEMIKLRDSIGLYLTDIYYLTVVDGVSYVANDEGISKQMRTISQIKALEFFGIVGIQNEQSHIAASINALTSLEIIKELLGEFQGKSLLLRKLSGISRWKLRNSLEFAPFQLETGEFEVAAGNPLHFIWMLLDQLDRDSGTGLFKDQFRGFRRFWNGSRVPFSMLRLDSAIFPVTSLADLIQKTIDLYHMSILRFPRILMIVLNEPSDGKMIIERKLRFSNRISYSLASAIIEHRDKKITSLITNQLGIAYFQVSQDKFQILKTPLKIEGVKILLYTLAES